MSMKFEKGHKPFPGIEKGWFKKGTIPWSKGQKGIHLSPSSEFKKGHTPWNTGKKLPHLSGENSGSWKGDDVGYFGVHEWLYMKYGKAKECENCHMKGKVEWANISGKYKRDISDWKQLCIPCHRAFDNWSVKMWATRRKNEKGIL